MAALWLVVALSVVGLEVGLASRQHRLVAINAAELLQAEASARAGVASTRAALSDLLRADAGRDPWFRFEVALEGDRRMEAADFTLAARDAGSALNLNTASEPELERFFRALRVDHGRAERIAQSILDWRDPDEAHRPRGAEREAYLRAGAPFLPRNGPFHSVAELRFVLHVDSLIYARAAPHLTVIGSGRVSVNAAPRPVLLALPGMSAEAAAVLERHRARGNPLPDIQTLARQLSPRARDELEAQIPVLQARAAFETREVEVVSTGVSDGGVRARVTALLVRGGESIFLVSMRTAE
jgi:general secretion pathway protein K